jgi:hypothetical protein
MKRAIALALILGMAAYGATIQWQDLLKGAKLPHGSAVTLAGQLSDLTCGPARISDVLNITGISASYPGQAAMPVTASISGSNWSIPLGALPSATAVNLQLNVTGEPTGAPVPASCAMSSDSGIQLTQSSVTQDLTKYAGFDTGALHAPRINELRQFYLVHIYPWGPVELNTGSKVPFAQRWSLAVGASGADFSVNPDSRIRNGKAFAYGLGFRLNKYFRVTAGAMVYRDAVTNRLASALCFGPSIDITALPGLTSIFSTP